MFTDNEVLDRNEKIEKLGGKPGIPKESQTAVPALFNHFAWPLFEKKPPGNTN
jgi:hypothetical protein